MRSSGSNSTEEGATAGVDCITNSSTDDGNATGDSTDDVGDTNDPSVLKSFSDSTGEVATPGVSGNGTDGVCIPKDSSSNSKSVGFTTSSASDEVSDDQDIKIDNDVILFKEGSVSKLTKESKVTKERISEVQSFIEINSGDNTGTPFEDLMTGGALNVAKVDLLRLQRVLEEKKKMMTIITDIVDAQHLFDTKTGAERDVAKEELLRLQQLLEGVSLIGVDAV